MKRLRASTSIKCFVKVASPSANVGLKGRLALKDCAPKSEAASALRASAAAGERAVVVRLAVVACQLLPGLDRAQGVELDPPLVEPHERVGLARMVDVPEVAP